MSVRTAWIVLLCLAASAAAAADGIDVWRLRLDATRTLVVTARGDAVVRAMLAERGAPYAVMYAAPDPSLQVPAAYRAPGTLVAGARLRGTGSLTRLQVGALPIALSLDIVADGSSASGSWTLGAATGSATGVVLRAADLAVRNAVDPAKAWPEHRGPTGDLVATPADVHPERDPARIGLVWVSEEVVPGLSTGPRFTSVPAGGATGLVAGGGRVYATYYVPAGTRTKAVASRDGSPAPWNLIDADEVALCVDAVSGATVWKRVFPLATFTYAAHKNEWQGCTPVLAGGRLYTRSSKGVLRCLDAATGEPLWTNASVGIAAPGADCRDGGHNLSLLDGVLLVGALNHGTGLTGIDAATGTVLWSRSSFNTRCGQPQAWSEGGRSWGLTWYGAMVTLTSPGPGTLHCFDPRTGVSRWTAPVGPQTYGHLRDADRLLVNGGADIDAASVYRALDLTASGAATAWDLPAPANGMFKMGAGGGSLLFADAWWLRRGDNQAITVADPRTGAVLASLPFQTTASANECVQYASDGIAFFEPESQHGGFAPVLYDIAARTRLGSFVAQHPVSTAYQVPVAPAVVDGRMYVRGYDGIYCYDLRAAGADGFEIDPSGNRPPTIGAAGASATTLVLP